VEHTVADLLEVQTLYIPGSLMASDMAAGPLLACMTLFSFRRSRLSRLREQQTNTSEANAQRTSTLRQLDATRCEFELRAEGRPHLMAINSRASQAPGSSRSFQSLPSKNGADCFARSVAHDFCLPSIARRTVKYTKADSVWIGDP